MWEVEILLRDTDEIMSWCEDNGVDYVFGLAKNERLEQRIKRRMKGARRRFAKTMKRGLPSAPLSRHLKFPATIGNDLTIQVLTRLSRTSPRHVVTARKEKRANDIVAVENTRGLHHRRWL